MAASIGLFTAYQAATGALDVSKMPQEQRDSLFKLACVSPQNYQEYTKYDSNIPGWVDTLIANGPVQDRPHPAGRPGSGEAAVVNPTKAGSSAGTTPAEAPAASAPGLAKRLRFDVKSVGELGAFVVLIVVFAILNPTTFLTAKNIQTILNQSAIPLIIAVGATLVILMGSIDLSVEGVMGAAGMTFVLMTANSRGGADYGVVVALIVALAVGMVLGLVSGLIHTRLKVPSFIVTLGVWYVGLGVATLLFGTEQIPFLTSDPLKAWPTSLTLGLPNSFWLAVLLVAAGAAVGRYTRLARWTYAIGNNEPIALGNGVPVARVKVINFVGAAGCSAFAGVLASIQIGAGSATVGDRQPVPHDRGGRHRRHGAVRRQGRHPAQCARCAAAHDPEQRSDPLGREPEHPVGRVRRRADRGDHRRGVAVPRQIAGVQMSTETIVRPRRR